VLPTGESENVYDITVEGTHCFFANNHLVHNCHSHLSQLRSFLDKHDKFREANGLKPAIVIGLSATPQAKDLGEVFKEIVCGPTKQWLVENGFLKPYRYIGATKGQLDRLVKSSTGEFTDDSLDAAFSGLGGDLVRDWKKHSGGAATIGFFPRLSHAVEATELLRKAGVRCEYIDGSTPDLERETILKMLRNGDTDYIANVGVIERGTDVPRVGCVQLCTSIGSIARYLQIIGRGSRPHPEVPSCLVIDHGGNVMRHGMFEDEVEWTLNWDTRPAKEHKPKKSVPCPSCGEIYRGGTCPACGYQPTKKELEKEGLNFNGSELVEIKKASQKKTEDPSVFWLNALYRAGKSGMSMKQAVGMAYGEAKRKNIPGFVIPREFSVAGKTFDLVRKGSADMEKKVSALYPFTIGDYSPESNRFMRQENPFEN
jgi:superfamily II DNA or RNA helicase